MKSTRKSNIDYADSLAPPQFSKKVEREIKRYGVDEAQKRWHVLCDYFQTEDWWPAVAREVEAVFDNFFEEKNQQQAEQNRAQMQPAVQLNISQQQGDSQTDNNFSSDSHCQVFNGKVSGQFG